MHHPRPGRLLAILSSLACSGPAAATLAAIFAAVFVSPALAQLQLIEMPKQYLPRKGPGLFGGWLLDTYEVAAGDVDGDGQVDLVFADYGEPNRLLMNNGNGVFSDESLQRLPGNYVLSACVALGDVDGDGDLDIMFGNEGQNTLFVNDGTGIFTNVWRAQMPRGNNSTRDLELIDVDDDGDLDLVVANSGQDQLLLNNGEGVFVYATATNMPVGSQPTTALAIGDVDGDGDPDLVLADNGNTRNRLYLNDGHGGFSDATLTQTPERVSASSDVALGDFDGDGDLDMVVANTGQSWILQNDGSGSFAIVTGANLPSNVLWKHLAVGDVDGDSDLDIVFDEGNRLFLNGGTGIFVEAKALAMPIVGSFSRDILLCDLDLDNDLDVVVCNDERDRLYLNSGTGTFVDATAPRIPAVVWSTSVCAAADVDGDRDVDLFFGSSSSGVFGIDHLFLNDGYGYFSDASASLPASPVQTSAAAFGDIDGDGDQDLVVGTGSHAMQNTRLYLNDGTGGFTDVTGTQVPNDPDDSRAVALVDVDGDADLDIVVGNTLSPGGAVNRLFLNDGSGMFAAAPSGSFPQLLRRTYSLAVGDVDGDGDVDLVFGNEVGTTPFPSQGCLYLNDGTGAFTYQPNLLPPATSAHPIYGMDLGDIDGDGDLDLVAAYPNFSRLYMNNGFGSFTVDLGRLSGAGGYRVALGDLDGDTDLDLIAVYSSPVYFLNTGQGFYQEVTSSRVLSAIHRDIRDIVLADIDNDADLDVIFGITNAHNRLLVNVTRQLDTPQFLRPGQPAVFDVYARYGLAGPGDIALVMLSTLPATIPLPPFGTFGLDPLTLVLLPPVFVTQPAGTEQVSFLMPNIASFVGVSVYAQSALVYASTGTIVLTNVTHDVIMP